MALVHLIRSAVRPNVSGVRFVARSFATASDDAKFLAKQQEKLNKLNSQVLDENADLKKHFARAQQIQDIDLETKRYFLTNAGTGQIVATTKQPVDTTNHAFITDELEAKFLEDIDKFFESPRFKLAVEIAQTNEIPKEKLKKIGVVVGDVQSYADVVLASITAPKQFTLGYTERPFEAQEQLYNELVKEEQKKYKLSDADVPTFSQFLEWKNSSRTLPPNAHLNVIG
eukprot:TRINITY_DN5147_c0_g1_i1.p1 TRINITY_DN5147_c0_g1~~TRINITY_DN5147_c0_g1_i1.p1  ORF type:complete len:228 (-),score=86.38 TRINITY_DN5147_c0_g1_i1:172-855(-)